VNIFSRYTVQIALLLLIIVFSFVSGDFLTVSNWINIIQQSAIIAVVAIGVTFVIITSGIDLSVGSVVALAGMVSAQLLVSHGLPAWLAIIVGIAIGVAFGLFNGIGVAYIGLAAFITTLATMSMGRGLALADSGGQTIFGLSSSYTFLGGGYVLGIPVPVIITFVLFVIAHFVLSRTVFGHKVYAIGGNREAARLAGINVRRIELLVYILAGALSGLAGIMLTGRLAAALPTSATGLELQVIAAIVIGGASLFGGRGNMIGTFFGVLTIGVLSNGLDLLNVSPFWVQFIQGVVIFLAVLIDVIGQHARSKNV
jgi:ribose/xylose/arabinose/galactoside ABC-type transport system permease subunit